MNVDSAFRIAEAVKAMILTNEAYGTPRGRAILIDWLTREVDRFGAQGYDVRDLILLKRARQEAP